MNDWIRADDTTRAWSEGPVVVWSPAAKVVCYRTDVGDFIFADGEQIEGVTHFFYVHPPHDAGVDQTEH